MSNENKSEGEPGIKGRLRSTKAFNYKSLKCICCKEGENPSPLHGTLNFVPDDKNKYMGCPPQIEIRPSGIPGAGDGIWAAMPIPKGMCFGPYRGKISTTLDTDSEYIWEVRGPKNERIFIDGNDTNLANWMRFANCSRNERGQNIKPLKKEGEVYYRAVKDIDANTELFIWYGTEFGKFLNPRPRTRSPPSPKEAGCSGLKRSGLPKVKSQKKTRERSRSPLSD